MYKNYKKEKQKSQNYQQDHSKNNVVGVLTQDVKPDK